jgi:peptide/nickel transport system substrate-binding protein
VQYRNTMYPIFITGWVADYADPHNFLYTFMHSRGVYGRFLAYKNDEVDRLCEAGIATVDPVKREQIYTRLQHLWYEEAVGIPLYQQINIRAYRDYVHGYIPNPMLTDAWEDLKRLKKE